MANPKNDKTELELLIENLLDIHDKIIQGKAVYCPITVGRVIRILKTLPIDQKFPETKA
jgi:hypothetical protein